MTKRLASEVLRSLDRELWIVTSGDDRERGGLLSTTVGSASIVTDLPRILVTIGHSHATWPILARTRHFALHLLTPDQADIAFRFGLTSGRAADKFSGLAVQTGDTGVPILSDSPAWLECRLESALDIGDRTVCLGEVLRAERRAETAPLTVQQLIQRATADQLQQLRAQLEADAAIDAEAIHRWRASGADSRSS